MLTKEQKDRIRAALNERFRRGAQPMKCPMCGTRQFSLTDSYVMNALQPELSAPTDQATWIPTVAIVCANCGFVSQHALGVLGLLPK